MLAGRETIVDEEVHYEFLGLLSKFSPRLLRLRGESHVFSSPPPSLSVAQDAVIGARTLRSKVANETFRSDVLAVVTRSKRESITPFESVQISVDRF